MRSRRDPRRAVGAGSVASLPRPSPDGCAVGCVGCQQSLLLDPAAPFDFPARKIQNSKFDFLRVFFFADCVLFFLFVCLFSRTLCTVICTYAYIQSVQRPPPDVRSTAVQPNLP